MYDVIVARCIKKLINGLIIAHKNRLKDIEFFARVGGLVQVVAGVGTYSAVGALFERRRILSVRARAIRGDRFCGGGNRRATCRHGDCQCHLWSESVLGSVAYDLSQASAEIESPQGSILHFAKFRYILPISLFIGLSF